MSEYILVPYQGLQIIIDDHYEPWLTEDQIGQLLGVTRQNVNTILRRAQKRGQLPEKSVRKQRLQAGDGKLYEQNTYNLYALMLVGLRSNSDSERIVAFRDYMYSLLYNDVTSRLRELTERVEQAENALADRTFLLADAQAELQDAQAARRVAEARAYHAESDLQRERTEYIHKLYPELDGEKVDFDDNGEVIL